MSDSNKIVADMVKDIGLEYVGKVIAGSQNPSGFIRHVLESGLSDYESCAAKAAIIQFNLTMKYGGPISMTMHRDGVEFERHEANILIDWLMMLEADSRVIEQYVRQSIVSDHAFAFAGRRAWNAF